MPCTVLMHNLLGRHHILWPYEFTHRHTDAGPENGQEEEHPSQGKGGGRTRTDGRETALRALSRISRTVAPPRLAAAPPAAATFPAKR
mmetsp:Transcript_28204/g.41472  ORF Transcript_28204/g.41472 Transcript_28204/m.41472 type:complete len:88 (+) Transcript_28204:707-970(+)